MAWMSEEAAATVLGVSFKTIRRRVGNGSIRAMRQGRQILVDIEIARISGPKQPCASSHAAVAVANTGSTNVATIDTPRSEPVGIVPSSHALPISPLASKALHAAAISTTSTSSSPLLIGVTPTSPRELPRRQWSWLAIWLLLTLLLTTCTVSVWIYQQGQARTQEAQSRYQQVMLEAQQAQDKHSKLIATANQREHKLIGELSTANAKLDETTHNLADQRNVTVTLKANLDKASAELANTQSERKAIADKFVSAQATAQVLRWQVSFGETFRQLTERIPQPKRSSHTTPDRLRAIPLQPVDVNDFDWTQATPTASPGTTPAKAKAPTATLANAQAAPASANANASNESDENTVYHRPLPHQPATLSQEDARATLRAIIKSEQSDADSATNDRIGIAPEPN